MQRASRLKFFIIATIACAILFCIAAFSVSLAQWDMSDDHSFVKVQGSSDLFYVEYPQYVTDGGVAIPALDSGKYYLQVQKDGGVSDYYRMTTNPSDASEVMLTNVYIKAGTVLDVYKGTDKYSIRNKKDGSAAEFEHDGGNTPATATVSKTGYYNFYYQPGYWTMYATYSATLTSGGSGSGGTTTTVAPTRDLTKQSCKVVFHDCTIVFEATGHESQSHDVYLHIWREDSEGNRTTWPGLKMNKSADEDGSNTITFNWDSTDVIGILIHCYGQGGQTGDKTVLFDEKFPNGLKKNYTYTFGVDRLHGNDSFNSSWTGFGGNLPVTEKAPQTVTTGGNTGTTTTVTAAKPTTTGATDFNTADQKPNDKVETVRVMNANMKKVSDGKYEYHNYICVSRQNTDDSADDNSIAILEFKIEGKGNTSDEDLKTIPVSSITLTRRDTDNEGNPLDGFIDPAPRVYNYDLTNPVYLSQIGHGSLHETFDDVDAQGKNTANMIAHYDDGMYVILYFADKKQQYFALDLSIETTQAAEFTLTASVNNTNMWDRYKFGFGEEWGYYMGGLINEVWMWHPTRTTKFEVDTGAVKYDHEKELEALGLKEVKVSSGNESAGTLDQYVLQDVTSNTEWKNLTDAQRSKKISDFNNNGNFNYNIVDYSEKGAVTDKNGYPMWARYTQDYVDITLTINLVADSKIKLCMLDWSGERGDIGNGVMRPTTYYLPNKIISYPEDLFENKDTYDQDLNFKVPASGEYSFRYVGYVHNYTGKWMSKTDGTILDSDDGNCKRIDAYNFVIDELYISKADVVGEMITVTFDPNGGTFDADAPLTQLVRFGNAVNIKEEDGKAPKASQITAPVGSDKVFGGWQYKKTVKENGVTKEVFVDYDGDPVLDDLTLFAKWVGAEYKITFSLKGGKWKSNAPANGVLSTGEDGRIPADLIPEAEKDNYIFVHWVDGDGNRITQAELAEHVFAKHTTLTAVWEEKGYTVTFNLNGLPIAAIAAQTVKSGDKATEPSVTAPAHYTFVGWYENAKGTGSAFDFAETEISGDKELFAKWTADDGVYVNGTYVGEISANTDKPTVTSTRLKALGVLLKAGETAKFRYNNKNITSALYIRSNSPAAGNITPSYATGTKNIDNTEGLTAAVSGWYDMYYEDTNGNGSDGGIWLVLAHAYEDSNFNEDTDGLYNGNDKLEPFAVNDEASYELTATVTLAASTTISIKYNNKVQTVTKKDGSLGTFSGGKVTLGAGTYSFYYDYIAKTLYIEGKYQITFDANDGAWADGDTTKTALTNKIESGSATLSAMPTDPSRGDKYTFKGWYTTKNGNTKVTSATAFSSAATVYAQWTQVKYDITFDLNGGNVGGNTANVTETTGTDKKLTASQIPTPTRTGLAFGGWYTSAENNASTKVDVTAAFSGDTTVYAKWQYTVKFKGNGGTWAGGVGEQSHPVDQGGKVADTIVADIPTTAPEGKAFDCWSTSDSTSGGAAFTGWNEINANTTLYAQWKDAAATVTITFDANGGTCTTDSADTVNGKLTSIPTASKDLHSFDGWYTSDGDKVTTSTTFDADTTITARYTANQVRIKVDVSGWIGKGTSDKYHVYAKDNSGEFTTFANRYLMTSTGTADQYSYDLPIDKVPTVVIITRDNASGTELSRYEISVSASLGGTVTIKPEFIRVTLDLSIAASWGKTNMNPRIWAWQKVGSDDINIADDWNNQPSMKVLSGNTYYYDIPLKSDTFYKGTQKAAITALSGLIFLWNDGSNVCQSADITTNLPSSGSTKAYKFDGSWSGDGWPNWTAVAV